MAKNWGEPQKMTHSSETAKNFGWSEWESFSPGYTGDMPCRQKSKTENRPLAPNIQVFGSKLHILFLAAKWSPTGQYFQHKKVPHWFPDIRVPKVLTPFPPKMDFWPKNGQI